MSGAARDGAGPRWWERFFDGAFAELWLSDDDAGERERRTDGLMRVLGLRAGSRLFDQCCGVGRVAVPLVARGVHVEGVDGVASYVARARARCEGLPAGTLGRGRFECGDARTYVPAVRCDAAINWYTSFGYSDDDAANTTMLARVWDALRPGGLFALDYPDMERVRACFQPRSERTRDTPSGRFVAVREAHLDERRGMLVDRWTFVAPSGETRTRAGETRLYSGAQLHALLRSAGFVVLSQVAPRDVGYAEDAGRCILLARRPLLGEASANSASLGSSP
jgi:SAM-dependent methyltransferase